MATIDSAPVDAIALSVPARMFIAADLAAMPADLPSGPVDYELDNGRLVPMSPTGRRHGQVQSAIASALHTQGQLRGLGEAYVETGVVLWRNPDRVVGPDASFISSKSLPARESAEGFLETIPELVVEVRSKNDASSEIDRKISDYLKAGVRVVWLVEPEAAVVVEHRSGQSPRVFGTADVLACEDVIPGFQLALAELFR